MSNLTCRRTKDREQKLQKLGVSFTELVDWALDTYSKDIDRTIRVGRCTRKALASPKNKVLCEVVGEAMLEEIK